MLEMQVHLSTMQIQIVLCLIVACGYDDIGFVAIDCLPMWSFDEEGVCLLACALMVYIDALWAECPEVVCGRAVPMSGGGIAPSVVVVHRLVVKYLTSARWCLFVSVYDEALALQAFRVGYERTCCCYRSGSHTDGLLCCFGSTGV